MGGGGKVPYPKHVWSPAGGWYAQPANWKANTAIMMTVIFGISAWVFSASARLEHRDNLERLPSSDRFFPSRHWSKQIIEYEKAQKEKAGAEK